MNHPDNNLSLNSVTFRDEIQGDHLLISIEGDFEGHMTESLFRQVMVLCGKHQAIRVLIDTRKVQGSPSVIERFNIGKVFADEYSQARSENRIPIARFALVGAHPLVDPRRFGELVAVNRGAPVRVFLDEKEALAWLTKG